MKLFNRKKDNSTNDEIKNYYAEERRDRTGVAWLLAAATLVVTLLLALGLFYGGRWAYRAIFDDETNTTDTVQQEADEIGSEDIDVLPGDEGNSTDQNAGTDGDQATSPGDSTDETEGGNDASGDDANPDDAEGVDTSDSSDDRLPSSGALPATGPTEPEL